MKTFDELGLDTALLESIREIGFETPSPIQEEVIPYLLESSGDVIALAQTGTGKTAAFGLPILQKTDLQLHEIQALVLSPTRELCVQIATELKRYSTRMEHLHLVAVYGGGDIRKQLKALDRTPQ
ncbi:MAG: DEAD/DEAH box helicase, partial [Paludibacteraceae bacterium]|nr:DEAD/DEAH box helicase [Paludibacteraceae bacterium]